MDDMKEWEERTARRTAAHLQAHVPPAIRLYLKKGGPNEEDFGRVRSYAPDIGSFGDAILFPNGKGNEKAHLEKLVDGVAVLSFCPGGVHLLGIDFDAAKMQDEPAQDELCQLIADLDRIIRLTPRRRYGNTTQME
jgi:hypothetical protein